MSRSHEPNGGIPASFSTSTSSGKIVTVLHDYNDKTKTASRECTIDISDWTIAFHDAADRADDDPRTLQCPLCKHAFRNWWWNCEMYMFCGELEGTVRILAKSVWEESDADYELALLGGCEAVMQTAPYVGGH